MGKLKIVDVNGMRRGRGRFGAISDFERKMKDLLVMGNIFCVFSGRGS